MKQSTWDDYMNMAESDGYTYLFTDFGAESGAEIFEVVERISDGDVAVLAVQEQVDEGLSCTCIANHLRGRGVARVVSVCGSGSPE